MLVAECACGTVGVAITGAPFASAICHCDDCQAAAKRLADDGVRVDVTDADGGTPYVLVAADRVAVTRGADRLRAFKLKPHSPTNRQIATCCNTPVMVDFDRGPFWVSVYAKRLGAAAPPPRYRVQTRHVADEMSLPAQPLASRTYPLPMMIRIAAAGAAMGLRRLFGR